MDRRFIGNRAPANLATLPFAAVVVTAANWPTAARALMPLLRACPQFATAFGQQIGQELVPCGTYCARRGRPSATAGCGYLGNPYHKQETFSARRSTAHYP